MRGDTLMIQTPEIPALLPAYTPLYLLLLLRVHLSTSVRDLSYVDCEVSCLKATSRTLPSLLHDLCSLFLCFKECLDTLGLLGGLRHIKPSPY